MTGVSTRGVSTMGVSTRTMRQANRDRALARTIRAGVRPIARELRTLYKRVDGLHARQARAHLTGKVTEVRDGPRGTEVRLALRPADPKTGKVPLSPWVQAQESAGDGVGGFSTHIPVAVGEPMRLFSPHGEIGSGSVAIRDAHDGRNKRPTEDRDELAIKHGEASLRISAGHIELKLGEAVMRLTAEEALLAVGDAKVRVTGDEVITTKPTRLNNGTRQIHYVGGKDSDGDRAVDGADSYV